MVSELFKPTKYAMSHHCWPSLRWLLCTPCSCGDGTSWLLPFKLHVRLWPPEGEERSCCCYCCRTLLLKPCFAATCSCRHRFDAIHHSCHHIGHLPRHFHSAVVTVLGKHLRSKPSMPFISALALPWLRTCLLQPTEPTCHCWQTTNSKQGGRGRRAGAIGARCRRRRAWGGPGARHSREARGSG